jgi:hypothetical protein
MALSGLLEIYLRQVAKEQAAQLAMDIKTIGRAESATHAVPR